MGANGTAGGLAGVNSGTITNAFATGNVTGTAGVGGISTLGGLVGSNQGEGKIATSSARGDVGGLNIANLQAGGLVGSNAGTISVIGRFRECANRRRQHSWRICRLKYGGRPELRWLPE